LFKYTRGPGNLQPSFARLGGVTGSKQPDGGTHLTGGMGEDTLGPSFWRRAILESRKRYE